MFGIWRISTRTRARQASQGLTACTLTLLFAVGCATSTAADRQVDNGVDAGDDDDVGQRVTAIADAYRAAYRETFPEHATEDGGTDARHDRLRDRSGAAERSWHEQEDRWLDERASGRAYDRRGRVRRGLGRLRREPGRRDGALRVAGEPDLGAEREGLRARGRRSGDRLARAGLEPRRCDRVPARAHAREPGRGRTGVDRMAGWPGQGLAYAIGSLEVRRLRELAEHELGDTFDIREFHDRVLEDGSITLPMLREKLEAWVRP